MLDKSSVASAFKRIKIDLGTYDSSHDLKIRCLFDTLTPKDLPVLEEILHSSVQTSLNELLSALEMRLHEVSPCLDKLQAIGLLEIRGEQIAISKETRKLMEVYFERTAVDFSPGIEFAFSILRTLPVQMLAVWYALPKTSTNLTEALIEKFFHTPQLYKRHLDTTLFEEEPLNQIFAKILSNPQASFLSSDLKQEFNLSDEAFHRIVLFLELNFIAYLSYETAGEKLISKLTVLREYTEYLGKIERGALFSHADIRLRALREGPFSFLRDMDAFVEEANAKQFDEELTPEQIQITANKLGIELDGANTSIYRAYFGRLRARALKLRLLEIADGQLVFGSAIEKWRGLSEDDRAFCYLRHPALQPPADEKSVRAAEKSISAVIGKGWIRFEDFIQAALIPLRPEIEVRLKGRGHNCHYALPEYTDTEKELVHHVIFQSLAEAGFVETAEDCFRTLPFGELVFGNSE